MATKTVPNAVISTKHTIPIGWRAMYAATTSPPETITQVEHTAGQPETAGLGFDATADEFALFEIPMPKSWNEGTITYKVFWTSSGAVTTGVAWALQGVAISDGDAIDTAFGTAVVVTDDAQGVAYDQYVTAESGAVTIGGTPAAGDMAYFRIYRDVSDANDDMTQDAILIAVHIYFNVDSFTDA